MSNILFPEHRIILSGQFKNGDRIEIIINRKNIPDGKYRTEDSRGLKFSEEQIEKERLNSEIVTLAISDIKYFYNNSIQKKVRVWVSKLLERY